MKKKIILGLGIVLATGTTTMALAFNQSPKVVGVVPPTSPVAKKVVTVLQQVESQQNQQTEQSSQEQLELNVQENIDLTEPQVESEQEGSLQFAGSDAHNSLIEESSSTTPTVVEPEGIITSIEEVYRPSASNSNLASHDAFAEFVIFEDQTLSKSFPVIILGNLNKDTYGIGYQVYQGDECIYTSDIIDPTGSEAVDLFSLLDNGTENSIPIQIVATAFTKDHVALNSLAQDITITLDQSSNNISSNEQEAVSSTTQWFKTSVVYVANGTNMSVFIPAVVKVPKGEYGVSFDIGFSVSSLQEPHTLYVGVESKQLNGLDIYNNSPTESLGQATCDVRATYDVTKADNRIYWVGPSTCMLEGNKRSAIDYYGTVIFTLKKEVL